MGHSIVESRYWIRLDDLRAAIQKRGGKEVQRLCPHGNLTVECILCIEGKPSRKLVSLLGPLIQRHGWSGKLKPVEMGGKQPKFRRSDIERIKAEGLSVLKKIARQPRAPRAGALPVELEPLESMLARAKHLAKVARAAAKSAATQHQTQHADASGRDGTH